MAISSTRSGSSTSCAAPGRRVVLDPPPFGPGIGGIVMPDIAEEEAGLGPVDDQPDAIISANRPEIRVTRPVEPVQTQARSRRVQLQIERRHLDSLLLCPAEPREAGGEGILNKKFRG